VLQKQRLWRCFFYVGYNLVYSASSYVHGLLADRFPKNRVLAVGYSLAVIPAAALATPGDSIVKFAIAFAFSGVYMGAWETLESATAATLLPANVRGTGFGVLAAVAGVGDFLSSATVGLLWAWVPAAAMALVGISALVGAGVIVTVRPPGLPEVVAQEEL
jgi:MFS family permease